MVLFLLAFGLWCDTGGEGTKDGDSKVQISLVNELEFNSSIYYVSG
jgi:hypothetical protein